MVLEGPEVLGCYPSSGPSRKPFLVGRSKKVEGWAPKQKPRSKVQLIPKSYSGWGGVGPGLEHKSYGFFIPPKLKKVHKKPMSKSALQESLDPGLDSSLGRGGPSSSDRQRKQPNSQAVQATSSSGTTGSSGGSVTTMAPSMGAAQLSIFAFPVSPLNPAVTLSCPATVSYECRQHGASLVRTDIAGGSPHVPAV
ncbi:hypothetical protein SLA2020_417540 [Shorea laevis]